MAIIDPPITTLPMSYEISQIVGIGIIAPLNMEKPETFPDPPTEGQLYPVGDGRDYLE